MLRGDVMVSSLSASSFSKYVDVGPDLKQVRDTRVCGNVSSHFMNQNNNVLLDFGERELRFLQP